MTISKKIKGLPFHKKAKKATSVKQSLMPNAIVKNNLNHQKKWQKNIKVEFEDEFLNNSLLLNNILE